MSDEVDAGRAGQDDFPRDQVESVVRDVLDEEFGAYEREVTVVVAAVVGGGLMLLSAFSVAGVALLAPDPLVVIGVLLALGVLLLLASLVRIGTRRR
ncbi:MAG: hypothetical protein ABEH81_14145 [Halopenitus sp.]